jgi:hypothetical protein
VELRRYYVSGAKQSIWKNSPAKRFLLHPFNHVFNSDLLQRIVCDEKPFIRILDVGWQTNPASCIYCSGISDLKEAVRNG